jgi:zinc D-Ala-D-Ala carboxypeptidase
LDKAGIPDKSPPAVSAADDIPIAYRETPALAPASTAPSRFSLLVAVTAAGLLALAGGVIVALQLRPAAVTPVSTTASTASPAASPAPNQILGHFAYDEAPLSELDSISADGGIKLRRAAAKAYREMAAAAARDGVTLTPLSGFRSKTDQQGLYFDIKAERNQTPAERAKVSAPPGYSEHHTGYALDIGDGGVPAMNLEVGFEKTPAYQWLAANANRYQFELSFTKGNPQGVSYEPWHWRYVGDPQSLETFYKARQK